MSPPCHFWARTVEPSMEEGECHKALKAPIQMLSSAFSANQAQGGFCLSTDSASPPESAPDPGLQNGVRADLELELQFFFLV